jgi:CBS domain-containing protein
VGALLVMREGQLLGIVSERDYTRKVALRGRSSKETLVREITSEHLHTATPEYAVEECMRLMTIHRIRHLPVIQEGKVIGVVSVGDLINWIISTQSQVINQLSSYIQGHISA